jgi:hypothetical protein
MRGAVALWLAALPCCAALHSGQMPRQQCRGRHSGAYLSAEWRVPQAWFDGEKPSVGQRIRLVPEGEGAAPLDMRTTPATAFFSPDSSSSSSGSSSNFYSDEDDDYSEFDLPPADEPIREGEDCAPPLTHARQPGCHSTYPVIRPCLRPKRTRLLHGSAHTRVFLPHCDLHCRRLRRRGGGR